MTTKELLIWLLLGSSAIVIQMLNRIHGRVIGNRLYRLNKSRNECCCERMYILECWWFHRHRWKWNLRSRHSHVSRRNASKLSSHHVVRIGLCFGSYTTSTCFLGLFDLVRYFDHQVCVRQARVFGSYFGHGFAGCLFHFLFVTLFDIIM